MPTHGLGGTIRGNWDLQRLAPNDVRPVDDARLAEVSGFHSLWFSDHVALPLAFTSRHSTADPIGGRSCYPDHPDLLDAFVTMGAVVAATERILVAPSVLIAPYRHPLSDARQLVTIDHLSQGRLIVGVGAGWLREEFDALGVSFDDRVALTEECIEIYRRAWTDRDVQFDGRHFAFAPVSIDPKPLRPPPIVFGGASKLTVRLAIRRCSGYFPTFVDQDADPDRYRPLHDEALRTAEAIGRDPSTFSMAAVVSARIDERTPRVGVRSLCSGGPDAVLEDLARFAKAGYSLVVMHPDCPSGTRGEFIDQVERLGAEIVGPAHAIHPEGPWGTGISTKRPY